MKKFFTLPLLVLLGCANAQSLEKVWETPPVVATPESVLPDTKNGILYISLIDGAPWEADGKGGVGRMKTDGSQYDSAWITGLNAPKGMGLYQNRLYVADIDQVVVIDITSGKIQKRITVPGATGLNDITVSDNGQVYVSDSKTASIWRLQNDAPTLYLQNMQGVNGLKAVGSNLLIASGKSFVMADAAKKITPIAELPQGGDGVEPVGNGDYLVSAWSGYLFYVTAGGTVKTLLETHQQKINTADIGYDAEKRMVYVPTFFGNTIVAYRLRL